MSVADPVGTNDEILLSSDGHVAEPVDLWETRLPEKFRDRAPRFPNIKYGEHNHARLGGRAMGIAADVLVGQHEMPHGVAVVTAEPVAPVIPAAAVLGLARLGVD